MHISENIERHTSDFRKDVLEIEKFLNGTRVSFSFFEENFSELVEEFMSKERGAEELEGMKMFVDLAENLEIYDAQIFVYCFISLIARKEAFLNDIGKSIYEWKRGDLSTEERKKQIISYFHLPFKKKITNLKNKFGMEFPEIEKWKADILKLISIRNVVLHNSGVVNETYLRINKDSKLKLGDKVVVTESHLKLTFVVLIIIAKSIQKKLEIPEVT